MATIGIVPWDLLFAASKDVESLNSIQENQTFGL